MSGYEEDDWEAILEKEEAEEAAQRQKEEEKKLSQPAKQTDAQPALKRATASDGPRIIEYKAKTHLTCDPEDIIAIDDPALERERRERLIRKAEAQLFGDLLEGCDIETDIQEFSGHPNTAHGTATVVASATSLSSSLDALPLKNLTDCKKLADMLAPKISASPAKSTAWLELLTTLVVTCAPKMEKKDLTTLKNKIHKIAMDQETSKKEQVLSKRKGNESTKSQITNHKEEYMMFYGGGAKDASEEESESSADDDDDGFM